ncbi:hypothetical protein BKI52_38165 [marine bacterium AO1-C]|nr:hypothetical protein BKI52_38165 [marine bacterium AO1-C]
MKRLIIFYWIALLGLTFCQNAPTQTPQKIAIKSINPIIRKPIRLLNKKSSAKGIDALKGVWIRKDLVKTIKKTRSWFETKQILEKKPWYDVLAMSIEKDYKDDYLQVCLSSFGTQMPTILDISCDQEGKNKSYQATSNHYKSTFYLTIIDQELVVEVRTGNTIQKLIFLRRPYVKPECFNQVRGTYDGVMMGNYQLLNAKKEYLQDVWFDVLGRTNMPDGKKYALFHSAMNSIHHSPELHYLKNTSKEELIEKGAVNQEDVMYLYNSEKKGPRETFIEGQLIVEKIPNGFKLYTIKTNKGKEKVIWGLYFKKHLKYYLIQK